MGVAHWPQLMRKCSEIGKRIGQIVAAVQPALINHLAAGGHHDDIMHFLAISGRSTRLSD